MQKGHSDDVEKRAVHTVSRRVRRTCRGDYRISSVLLELSGAAFLVAGLVYSKSTVAMFDPHSVLESDFVAALRWSRGCLAFIGVAFILLPRIAGGVHLLARFLAKRTVQRILLAVLTTLVPLSILELTFRPMAMRSAAEDSSGKTSIFVRDRKLGWRLRPGSKDDWSGAHVEINNKGVRGPERTYEKDDDVRRILFLGDSVTFGVSLEDYEDTFPHLVEHELNGSGPGRVEVINAGVGGYSPWQEYGYLAEEGIRYAPDLVVVSFVLNDVTEKLTLRRFGGHGDGFQLRYTAPSPGEAFVHRSGLGYFLRALALRVRFGKDVYAGARREELLSVQGLCRTPEHPQIREAWKITLDNLDKIFTFCERRNVRSLLVVFPFTFQFDSSLEPHPQKILREYAAKSAVGMIDLLPILAGRMKEDGLTTDDLFLDQDHLTSAGSEVVANIIVEHIRQCGLLEVDR